MLQMKFQKKNILSDVFVLFHQAGQDLFAVKPINPFRYVEC